jgi:hypothetical protein
LSYVITERGIRFLGDSKRMLFHDLLYEEEGTDGCGIDLILEEGHAVGFFPDKREQARMEGFEPCPKCMG